MSTVPPAPTRKPGPSWAATARKALTAAAVAAVGAVGAAMLDGDLTSAEGLIAAGTGLLAGVATYQVKNHPA